MAKKKLDLEVDKDNVVNRRPAPQHRPHTFDEWWAKFASKYQVSQDLKGPLEAHMKARGFWEEARWHDGVRDFGYRLA